MWICLKRSYWHVIVGQTGYQFFCQQFIESLVQRILRYLEVHIWNCLTFLLAQRLDWIVTTHCSTIKVCNVFCFLQVDGVYSQCEWSGWGLPFGAHGLFRQSGWTTRAGSRVGDDSRSGCHKRTWARGFAWRHCATWGRSTRGRGPAVAWRAWRASHLV